MTIQAVLCDQREPPEIQHLDFGAAKVITLLDVGDVWLAVDNEMLIIERKTSSDLLASIADGRLFDQCARMRQQSPWCYLVVAGQIRANSSGHVIEDEYINTQWTWNSVQGALLTVQELGVSIVYCLPDDFAGCVKRLAGRARGDVRVQKRTPYTLSAGEAVLASLPGIGEERIDLLLDFSGSPAWALSYLTTLGEPGVDGIGDGIKRRVRAALGLNESEILEVIIKEKE